MATDPDFLLQTAIFEALQADATLMARVKGVFDAVPDNLEPPFVSIGEMESGDWGSHTFDGANATITIHSWARGAGRKTVKQIMGDVYRILHNVDLVVSGFKVVVLRREFQSSMLDPDGQTYHGVQRFRILIGGA